MQQHRKAMRSSDQPSAGKWHYRSSRATTLSGRLTPGPQRSQKPFLQSTLRHKVRSHSSQISKTGLTIYDSLSDRLANSTRPKNTKQDLRCKQHTSSSTEICSAETKNSRSSR